MRRNALALAGLLLLLPVMASASHEVNVQVRVNGTRSCGWDATETWIDFRPDRGAFVAVYAAYSDGSVELVFPAADWRNHWVEPVHGHSVAVRVPRGLHLESVQAVASRRWFDPAECWVAYAPRHHGERRARLVVTSTSHHPLFAWSFSLVWGSSHGHRVIRTGWGEPLRIAAAGRDAALPRTDRWTSGGRPGRTYKVKAKAAPGKKSSKSWANTGEPKRRSRR